MTSWVPHKSLPHVEIALKCHMNETEPVEHWTRTSKAIKQNHPCKESYLNKRSVVILEETKYLWRSKRKVHPNLFSNKCNKHVVRILRLYFGLQECRTFGCDQNPYIREIEFLDPIFSWNPLVHCCPSFHYSSSLVYWKVSKFHSDFSNFLNLNTFLNFFTKIFIIWT